MLGMIEILILIGVGISVVAAFITLSRRWQQPGKDAPYDQYQAIRSRIERRFRRRMWFGLHVVAFLFLNTAFWLWMMIPRNAAFYVTGAWALILVSHALKLWFDEAQERAIEREIARVQGYGMGSEKPKRRHVELSEDGELVETGDDVWDEKEKHRLN
jgi:hypothetical protein